jgi:hypothetical protein
VNLDIPDRASLQLLQNALYAVNVSEVDPLVERQERGGVGTG